MNALRHRLSSHMLNKKSIMKSIALSTALTTISSTSTIALCEGKGKGNKDDDDDILTKIKFYLDLDTLGQTIGGKVNDAIATGVPTEISYGFVCGFSSGFALKKIGKVASVVFGLGFVSLQALSYSGYIDVDHAQLKKDVEKAMDFNNDGKVDGADMHQAKDKVMEVLQFGMNGGAGFAAGFVGGFRSG